MEKEYPSRCISRLQDEEKFIRGGSEGKTSGIGSPMLSRSDETPGSAVAALAKAWKQRAGPALPSDETPPSGEGGYTGKCCSRACQSVEAEGPRPLSRPMKRHLLVKAATPGSAVAALAKAWKQKARPTLPSDETPLASARRYFVLPQFCAHTFLANSFKPGTVSCPMNANHICLSAIPTLRGEGFAMWFKQVAKPSTGKAIPKSRRLC